MHKSYFEWGSHWESVLSCKALDVPKCLFRSHIFPSLCKDIKSSQIMVIWDVNGMHKSYFDSRSHWESILAVQPWMSHNASFTSKSPHNYVKTSKAVRFNIPINWYLSISMSKRCTRVFWIKESVGICFELYSQGWPKMLVLHPHPPIPMWRH